MAKITDADITVTTATRSEAEVRADNGVPESKVAPAPADAGGDDAAKKVAEKAVSDAAEKEADSHEPDEKLSEAGRTLRRSRADARKAKIQGEIDDLTRKRERERSEYERERAEREAEKKRPPTGKPADAKPNADGKASAPQKFTFPKFEEWQKTNPDSDWNDYLEVRDDAKDAFNEERRKEANAKAEEERDRDRAEQATREVFARATQFEAEFKTAHPDYDEKLATFKIPGLRVENGEFVPTAQWVATQRALMRAGKEGPGILYHLATHHDDATRLLTARSGEALLEVFAEIKVAARAATKPSPSTAGAVGTSTNPDAVVDPAQPRTNAPAPLSAVPGGASATRSIQSIADDGDDADSYIARRKADLKRAG